MLGNLVISPQSAHLTHNTELITRMDPYVRVIIGNQIQDSLVARNFHKEPFWRGDLAFVCPKDQIINFEIWDRCKIGKDRLVGACSLTLAGLTDNYFFEWIPLYFKSKSAGQFLVCIHYYPIDSNTRTSDKFMSAQQFNPINITNMTSNMNQIGSENSNWVWAESQNRPISSEIGMMRTGMEPNLPSNNFNMNTMNTGMPPIRNLDSEMTDWIGKNSNTSGRGILNPTKDSNLGKPGMDSIREYRRSLGGSMGQNPISSEFNNLNIGNSNTNMRSLENLGSQMIRGSGNKQQLLNSEFNNPNIGNLTNSNDMRSLENFGSEMIRGSGNNQQLLGSGFNNLNIGNSNTNMKSLENFGSGMMRGSGNNQQSMTSEFEKLNPMNKTNLLSSVNPMGNKMGMPSVLGSGVGSDLERMYLLNKVGVNPMMGSNMGSNVGSKFMGSELGNFNKLTSGMGSSNPLNKFSSGMGNSTSGLEGVISNLESRRPF